MKILISAAGTDLSAAVDPRFGRAANFILVDADSMDYEVLENRQNFDLPQGAGIQAGKIAANSGADVVITGNCGPKAFTVLQKAGIKVVVGAAGPISEVIASYKNGDLKPAGEANVDGHWI